MAFRMTLDPRLVLRTALVGLVLQLALAGAGHWWPSAVIHLFLFGRAMLSATAGYLYGLIHGQSYRAGAFGGAIAGGLCVVPAVAVSVLLGDSPAAVVSTATSISILTGAVGGAFGQMGAILRRMRF
jgi:hypothetical protein